MILSQQFPALVSTSWLDEQRTNPDVIILDATYTMPGVSPSASEAFASGHIAGARFFDIEAVCDAASDLPHMLPSPEDFSREVGRLGVSNRSKVVVYDRVGLMSAGRVWWMFHVFGHDQVAILDGGMKSWLSEGRPVTTDIVAATARFTADFRPELIRTKDDLLINLQTGQEQIVDARSEARFDGREPEPRPGLRGGHVPGSLNLPFPTLTDPETGRVRSPDELRRLFERAGVAVHKPAVATCGTGVTAGAIAFALHLVGAPPAAVYDGSWSEWGLPGDTPVATKT